MPNPPSLKAPKEFTGGNDTLREHCNEVIKCIEAIVNWIENQGSGAGAGGNTVSAVFTVIDTETGVVELRKVSAVVTFVGDQITDDSQLAP